MRGVMGLRLAGINGFEGKVELVSTRAVAAVFSRWSLEQHGSSGWTLRAALSFSRDSTLHHPKFRRRVLIKEHTSGSWFEVQPNEGVTPRVVGDQFIIEGAQLCRTSQVGR
jgi:hypothetical protein